MNETVKPEKSKGQIFKEKKGYSKSFKRVMKKHDLDASKEDDVKEYKKIRKADKDMADDCVELSTRLMKGFAVHLFKEVDEDCPEDWLEEQLQKFLKK